jgi:hypothetical protein
MQHMATELKAILLEDAKRLEDGSIDEYALDEGCMDVPDRCAPSYLLQVLNNIKDWCKGIINGNEKEDQAVLLKMNRGFAHVRVCMVMLEITDWEKIREHFEHARIAFPESQDEELQRHWDDDDNFTLDIGGEG